MFRTLALSTLALLAVDGVSTVLAPATGLSLTGDAAAEDDKKDTTKTTVKKKTTKTTSSGSYTHSFWIKPGGKGGSWGSKPAGGSITLSDATTGAVVAEAELGTPFHGTAVGSTTTSESELGGTIEVGLEVEEAGVVTNPRIRFDISESRGDGASEDGWKATANLNPQGELRVVVMHEDRTWDGSTLTGLSVTTEDGTELPLDLDGAGSTLKADFDEDLDAYATLTASIDLVDAEGNVVETLEEDFEFEGTGVVADGAALALTEVSTGPDGKLAQLTTWTESDGSLVSLEVDLVDASTGESVIMTTDDTPVLTRQAFAGASISLEDDPATAAGYGYLVLVDWLDDNGDPTGEQQEVELTVPKYDAGSGEYGSYVARFDDGTGAVALLHDDQGLTALAWHDGEKDVAGVNLVFEEPFEGPVPLETEVSPASFVDLHKWTQVGDSSVPQDWSLTVSLVDEKGGELETSEGSSKEGTTIRFYSNRRDGQEEKYMEIICTDG